MKNDVADDEKCHIRLKAIREYTNKRVCEHTPPLFATSYIVTFAREDGIVVADCHFNSKEEADFIVNIINKAYNELGKSEEHISEWILND